MATQHIQAGRLEVALHQKQGGDGPPLLLLHALRGSSDDWGDVSAWGGPVFALDFSGHGASDWLTGGGYYPELFAADADQALHEIGTSFVVGAGVGAYVALLLAGARGHDVHGTLLLPGAGLDGMGSKPDFDDMAARFDRELASFEGPRAKRGGTDPMVRLAETDIRPTEYALAYGHAAGRLLLARGEGPLPTWWQALLDLPNATAVPSDASGPTLASRHLQPLFTKPQQR